MFITFDGKQVEVQGDETVLTVARREGIDIPALCFTEEPNVCPQTSCLVCLVKIGSRFVPSCATKVADGMSVESETDEVHQIRRAALELLLSDHLETCRTCGEGRKKCKLLRYTALYKADRKKWSGERNTDTANTNSDNGNGKCPSPLGTSPHSPPAPVSSKCIKCGICTSVNPALTFIGRGYALRVESIDNGQETADNERLSRVCPTAAIVNE